MPVSTANTIIDPDDVTYELALAPSSPATVEMTIDTTNRRIYLNGFGNLAGLGDGITGKALYSKFKKIWKSDATLIRHPFPMESITPEQFEFINGWLPADDDTRKRIRTAGWVERASPLAGGGILRRYVGVVSLGSIDDADQPYYQQSIDGPAINFTFTGPVNEAVKVYDAEASPIQDDSAYLKLFIREQGKLYGQADLADIGVTTMSYITYRFPLSTGTDLKIVASDNDIATTLPYTDINVTYLPGVGFTQWATATVYPANSVVQSTANNQWYITTTGGTSGGDNDLSDGSDGGITDWTLYTGQRQIGALWYPFNVIIDGDVANDGGEPSTQQIYEKIQYLLRQNSDIDAGAGTVTGKTADTLLRFVGDTLVTSEGVFIDDFDPNFTNAIEFFDSTNTKRTFPYVAAGNLLFNNNLVAEYVAGSPPEGAQYWMFFTTTPNGNDYGEDGAIIVQDADGDEIKGFVSGASVPWTFAYDSNTQGGRVIPGDPSTALAPNVTVVAIGLTTGQFVSTTATIQRAVGQNISLVAALERNYEDPV